MRIRSSVKTNYTDCKLFTVSALLTLTLLVGSPVLVAGDCEGVSSVFTSQIRAVPIVESLSGGPLAVTSAPGDRDRLFIVEQNGHVRVWHRGSTPDGHELFLDLSSRVRVGGERGLLGIAFDPAFATNGYFYLNYSEEASGDTVVSRFSVSATDPDQADPGSEYELVRIPQPAGNHNGGDLAFGPDGNLFITSGDGGGSNDDFGQCGNGQNFGNLLGGILRIRPGSTSGSPADCGGLGYRIPADQTMADGPGGDCDELWAVGLRNPWRFDIDPTNGDLYIGDVGQRCWEEIDWVSGTNGGGHNFGWRQMEGSHCFNPATSGNCDSAAVACGSSPACNDPTLILPVVEHPHSGDCAIIGGAVYRGCRLPDFDGTYFYGDRCSGAIRSLRIQNGEAVEKTDRTSALNPLGQLNNDLSAFGRDPDGELLLIDQGGTIFKMAPPFSAIETGGPGAEPFRLERNGDWSWEDVQFNNLLPIDYYRIYRGSPGAELVCIHGTESPSWVGDASVPAPGDLHAYIVTAVDLTGNESSPGGSGRILIEPCPAP